MAINSTEKKENAVCPFTGMEIEIGSKMPGKVDNFRSCLTGCVLKRINNMSAGVYLKINGNESDQSPLLASRCTLFDIIGGQDLVDLRLVNFCQMGGGDGSFCTHVYSVKGDGFDRIKDKYAESYWRICQNDECQKLTPVGMILKR